MGRFLRHLTMSRDPITLTDHELYALACAVGDGLLARGWQLAAAESCTGGWIAKLITDRAGSSQWFDRGFVTYSNAAKRDMLGVPETTLHEHGAVSEATVAAMVDGALHHSAARVALAVSGIAGPDGGSTEKPVGTVWFAWGVTDAQPVTERCCFAGDRDAVRRQAVAHALRGVIDLLGGDWRR